MFLCLVVNIEVVSIMPQYATFGNQVYPFGLIHNSSTPTNTSSVSASVSEFPSSTVPTSENVVTEDSSIWRSTAVRNYLPEGEYKTLHESNSSDDTNLKPCSQTAVSKLKKINLDRKYCVMTQVPLGFHSPPLSRKFLGIELFFFPKVGLFVHQLEIQLPFFGVAIFFANLGFCLVFLISCVCVTVCRVRNFAPIFGLLRIIIALMIALRILRLARIAKMTFGAMTIRTWHKNMWSLSRSSKQSHLQRVSVGPLQLHA